MIAKLKNQASPLGPTELLVSCEIITDAEFCVSEGLQSRVSILKLESTYIAAAICSVWYELSAPQISLSHVPTSGDEPFRRWAREVACIARVSLFPGLLDHRNKLMLWWIIIATARWTCPLLPNPCLVDRGVGPWPRLTPRPRLESCSGALGASPYASVSGITSSKVNV